MVVKGNPVSVQWCVLEVHASAAVLVRSGFDVSRSVCYRRGDPNNLADCPWVSTRSSLDGIYGSADDARGCIHRMLYCVSCRLQSVNRVFHGIY